jgi:hypothetical protein
MQLNDMHAASMMCMQVGASTCPSFSRYSLRMASCPLKTGSLGMPAGMPSSAAVGALPVFWSDLSLLWGTAVAILLSTWMVTPS